MEGQYIEAVLPAFFAAVPGQCGICRSWGRSRLCAACLSRFAVPRPRCQRCALVVPQGQPVCGACLREPPPFERAVTAFDYTHPWDGLIAHFKFHEALDLAPAFATQLVEAVRASGVPPPAFVLPVPLSAQRLRERGHNQAWEIARRVGRTLGLKSDARLLLRLRDTPHQLALPPQQRTANVRDAFAIEPRRRAELQGADVAVVDDVMTTGSTVAEISRVLLRCGAARVQVWMLARTPRPGLGD
jgi:ComF family protein